MNKYNDKGTFAVAVAFGIMCIALGLMAILFKIVMSIG